MEKASYMLTAFAVAWALVFGYVLLLLNRQSKLQQQINSLKEALKKKGIKL